MNKEDIISSGLLELYAMGMSSAEETKQVEEWLKEYPEVRQELNAIEIALEAYATSFAEQPSAAVKENIFNAINKGNSVDEDAVPVRTISQVSNNSKVVHFSFFAKAVAAAMIVLLIGSLALNFIYFNKYKSANDNLITAQNDLKDAQQKIAQKQEANAEMNNEMNVIGDKNSLPVVLNGTPHAPEAVAKIYWVKTSGEVYVDPTNLPKAPDGKQYQLWAIVDGKPVDAGMITTEKGTYHIQKMKTFGHAQAFAITLEKAGGSPTPTMDEMYVMSKV